VAAQDDRLWKDSPRAAAELASLSAAAAATGADADKGTEPKGAPWPDAAHGGGRAGKKEPVLSPLYATGVVGRSPAALLAPLAPMTLLAPLASAAPLAPLRAGPPQRLRIADLPARQNWERVAKYLRDRRLAPREAFQEIDVRRAGQVGLDDFTTWGARKVGLGAGDAADLWDFLIRASANADDESAEESAVVAVAFSAERFARAVRRCREANAAAASAIGTSSPLHENDLDGGAEL
jgi:hypothetical protein